MSFIKWMSKWFGNAKKSMGTFGIGLRAALSGGAPGGWASDHREETAHNTGFNYVAIHAIASQIAGATVTVFADGDQQPQRRARRKSLAARMGTFARWKSTYGADDRETDPLPVSHPLVRLLKRPNPYESGASFRYRQAQQIRLTGTCLIWNVPSVAGPACERYVIPTAMATPMAPTEQLPRGGWRINPVASRYTPVVEGGWVDCPSWYRILGQIIDARQVQMIRLPHAWYLDDGQSPLSAGAKWVDAGEAVDAARYYQLKNGIDPSIIWNLPPDVSPDQDEIDRVQAKISAKYGGPENVGRVMVAQNGTTVTPLTTSPREMCFTEGFHDFKAAILALHQTPPVAVGLQEPGAYAAYNASMKAWRHSAVQPLCDMLAESDTEHLAPQFGTGLTVEVESDTVDDAELLETQLRNDLAARVRTRNEWRAVRGMPPLSGSLGNELVGTNEDSCHDESSSDKPQASKRRSSRLREDDVFVDRDDESEVQFEPSTKTQTKTSSEPASDLNHDEKSSVLSNILPENFTTNEDLDNIARGELITEILSRLFGDDRISAKDAKADFDAKTYDPRLHPRDEIGRYTFRGSPEAVTAARQLISHVLTATPFTVSPVAISQALNTLTTREIEEINEEHGIVHTSRLRDHVVETVWARRMAHPFIEEHCSPIMTGSPGASDKVTVSVQDHDKICQMIGRKLTRQNWADLVGAQPGSRVHVFKNGNRSAAVVVEHPHYSAIRIIRPTEIENQEIRVIPEKRRQGIGARVLSDQVAAAAHHQFEAIRLHALGAGDRFCHASQRKWKGYITWARLGFDADLGEIVNRWRNSESQKRRALADEFDSRFGGTKRMNDLMRTKGGAKWWAKNGDEFEGHFPLHTESNSRAILEDYLKQKQLKRKRKSELLGDVLDSRKIDPTIPEDLPLHSAFRFKTPISSEHSGWFGEEPDELTPEDEQILDRVWSRLHVDENEQNSASQETRRLINSLESQSTIAE